MTTPGARVILDSISPNGHRLTTMEVTFHRFVLAEFNTHRVFSRNSASSRAIPVSKQLQRVIEDLAYPISWPAERPGMQGGDQLELEDILFCRDEWTAARDDAVEHAKVLIERGLHKSVVNRLLEPFMWHTAIVTATEYTGFFDQRCSILAQPELRVAAESMLADAYDSSRPEPLGIGDWHLPFVAGADVQWAAAQPDPMWALMRISVARCARVSYLTHDGVRDPEKDLHLYARLVSATPMHASPLEHVATPVLPCEPVPGNFHGWRQLRHLVESGELK